MNSGLPTYSALRFLLRGAAGFFIAAPILLFVSCKKQFDGFNMHPDSSALGVLHSDTFTLFTKTVAEDSIATSATGIALLGSYTDPYFGYTEAGFYTQLRLSAENPDFGNTSDITIDSVILSLVYSRSYGQLVPQSFIVFELTGDMSASSTYYSSDQIAHAPGNIGNIANITPDLVTSPVIGGDTMPPHLRIPLRHLTGRNLICADPSVYSSNAAFLSYFKGILVRPFFNELPEELEEGDKKKLTTANSGKSILYLDLWNSDSKLTVYFHHSASPGSPGSYEYLINNESASFSAYHHQYDNTPAGDQLKDPAENHDHIYVQSMAGVKGVVSFEGIRHLVSGGPVAINKAELVMEAEEPLLTEYPPHEQLLVLGIDGDGKSYVISDLSEEGALHYGGKYSSTTRQYTFNITRHLQKVLNNYANTGQGDFSLSVIPNNQGRNDAGQTVLKGGSNANGAMKLSVYYTPIGKNR